MIKHKHHEFPSDLFLILETAGAQLHISNHLYNSFSMLDMMHEACSGEGFLQNKIWYIMKIIDHYWIKFSLVESPGQKKVINFLEFMKIDMNHKLIYSVALPALTSDYVYRSYKVNAE